MFCEGMLILRFVWKSLELILEVDKCFLFHLKDGHICASICFSSLLLKIKKLYLQNGKTGASSLNIAAVTSGFSRAASLDELNTTYFKKHFYSRFSVGFPVELINLSGLEIKRIWKVSRIWFSESCIHLPFVVRNRTQRMFIPW